MGNRSGANPQAGSSNAEGDNYIYGGVLDPTVTAVAAPRGSLWIQMARKNSDPICLFQKLDNGKTTNWKCIGFALTINGIPVSGDDAEINFTGSGVVVTETSPGVFDIAIAGTRVEKEELLILDPTKTFNFKGVGVLVTQDGADPSQVNVEIPGLGGGGSPFNEKFYRYVPEQVTITGNANRDVFKDYPALRFSNGGTSTGLIVSPIINYQVGDDIVLETIWIADGNGGGNRNVFTQTMVTLFKEGDDVDTLTDIIKTDIYSVPSTDGLVYKRTITFTAAELGNPVDGEYNVKIEMFRDGTNPSDKFNKNIYMIIGRLFWEQ